MKGSHQLPGNHSGQFTQDNMPLKTYTLKEKHDIITKFEKSGLSLRAYAATNDITYSVLKCVTDFFPVNWS